MSDDIRGIVVSTPVIATRGRLTVEGSPLDAQELRYWLLFWDKLNFPLIEGINIGAGDDGEFLESIGVLERHRVSGTRIRLFAEPEENLPEEQFQCHFMRAFHELEAAERGTWSLATGDRSITLDEDPLEECRGVLVRLHRALPVPDHDVPLDDILRFKDKRRDELLALRCHLEATYQRIAGAPDGPLAIKTELAALDGALADFLKATRGGAIRRWRPTSVDAQLQILPGVNSAAVAFMAGLPMLQSLLTGVAASLSVSAGWGLKGLSRENGVPWQYVARYLDEVFSPQ